MTASILRAAGEQFAFCGFIPLDGEDVILLKDMRSSFELLRKYHCLEDVEVRGYHLSQFYKRCCICNR